MRLAAALLSLAVLTGAASASPLHPAAPLGGNGLAVPAFFDRPPADPRDFYPYPAFRPYDYFYYRPGCRWRWVRYWDGVTWVRERKRICR
ncbi:hypothetical protein QNA08_06155 [Chelatococcus sp. SYSU_G07232]|uniref:Uncharacterized protein n=1 Tax=Chelatococcus albus TaxID=3047466 RepID=A0ABT7AEM6_9HYPH|nr:hypothetical protein [Chelatococcus sp. SYSU_G07232]MDJ1157812.1 hypothetical protein [Chelatococcus sp. SYSU_G07232]